MPGIDPELVRYALQVARERGFSGVEIEQAGSRFSATLERGRAGRKPQAVIEAPAPPEAEPVTIKAPLVGYFRAPNLEVGKTVQQGDIVGVVAALGLDNDIESPATGEVLEVLVDDGDPVEYGQTLALLKVGT